MSCLSCDVGSHLHLDRCSVHSGDRQQAVRVRYALCFVCARQECVRGYACTLSDSMFHPHSFFSITTAIPPAQALPLSLHSCTSTTIPSPPPWLGTSLANTHLVHWSQSAFILSLLSSRAYSGFPLFYHIESQFLGLAFEAFHQLVLPTANLSPISFLIILLSSQATMLIDLHIWLTYFCAYSLPVNTSHFSLLIHA